MGKSRIDRERRTVKAMIRMFCRAHHEGHEDVCPDCSSLLEYAMRRLDRCPFAFEKPTCVKCKVHCYEPSKREAIRSVMRYSGPRMLLRHPYLAIMHSVDGRRQPKVLRKQRSPGD